MTVIFSVANIVECLSEISVIGHGSSAIKVDEACKDIRDSNKIIFENVLVVDSIYVMSLVVLAFILSVSDTEEWKSELLLSDNMCSTKLVEDACIDVPDSTMLKN